MTFDKKELEKSQIEFTITVSPSDYAPFLQKSATKIANKMNIKGFRKGHAPYDVVKKEAGEMAILQEALEGVVQKYFIEAVTEAKLDTIGMPKIAIEKLAPENDIVFTATVATLPSISLCKISSLKVKKEEPKVDTKKIDETLNAVRGMHAKEIIKTGKAEGTDKLVIDLDMQIDNVPVDGGQSKDYQVYLSEDHYIPGFNKEVTGLKKGEEKKFTLSFPKTHYQKHLAGKSIDFIVKVKEVYERQLPELTDELAKKLGQESVEKLTTLITENVTAEAEKKAEQKCEIDMLDAIIEKSTFGDLPDVLIDAERQKIFYELKGDIERNGITIDQYLLDIKKTEEELFAGFTEQATKRAKAALISRHIAKEQNIVISKEEIDEEIEKIKVTYAHNEEAQENVKKPEVQDSIAVMLQNKKTIQWVKEQLFGKEEKKEEKKEKKKEEKKK